MKNSKPWFCLLSLCIHIIACICCYHCMHLENKEILGEHWNGFQTICSSVCLWHRIVHLHSCCQRGCLCKPITHITILFSSASHLLGKEIKQMFAFSASLPLSLILSHTYLFLIRVCKTFCKIFFALIFMKQYIGSLSEWCNQSSSVIIIQSHIWSVFRPAGFFYMLHKPTMLPWRQENRIFSLHMEISVALYVCLYMQMLPCAHHDCTLFS